MEGDGVENVWAKTPSHTTYFLNVFFYIVMLCYFYLFPFPGMIASDSRPRNVGMDFFIPFPFPKFGNRFFHSLPIPEFGECFLLLDPSPIIGYACH